MSDSDCDSGESFFGLIVKPNKRYDTKVQKGFRLTKACIEPATLGGDKITSLYLEYDSDEFIISNLYKGQLSENLDILFNVGEQISFKVDGPGTIHLTGNTIDQEDPPFQGMGDFDDEDEDSEDVDMEAPDAKSVKRKIKELQKGNKKIKMDSSNGKADDEESSSEDDSDDDDTGAETTTLSDLDSTTNFAEEEDSDDSDDDEGEEEEDDSEGEDSDEENDSEEVKESPKKKAKVNGDVSPSKKAKLEAKSPKQKGAETPKADKSKKEAGTPKPNKTPKPEVKTPKAEVKTPKAEVKTPKQEAKSPKSEKTPKQDVKTPKSEKTPKQDVKTPKSEKTPKVEKTPKQEAAKSPKGDAPKTPKGDTPKTPKEAKTPKSVKKISGMLVEDIKEGTGAEVKNGRPIGMFYAGRLQTNNKQFDSCTQGKPFKFRLGAGEVIKGWDVGIAGMKVGGKRKLTIPPHMAYGSRGAPPDIPPNSTLVFDIECKFAS